MEILEILGAILFIAILLVGVYINKSVTDKKSSKWNNNSDYCDKCRNIYGCDCD